MNNYAYYNRRPDGDVREDCVCRAISTATGLKYEAVGNLLDLVSTEYECPRLCIDCYEKLLNGILGYKTRYGRGETVEEIASRYDGKKVIIRIKGHLTCSINGVVLDIWDCTKKIVDCFWVI